MALPPLLMSIVLGSLVVVASAGASAQTEPDSEPKRVAMASDLRVFSTSNEQPEGDNPGPSLEDLHRAMRQGAQRQWGSSYLEATVITAGEIDDAVADIPMYDDNLEVAREWGQMGIEAYKQVQTQAATEYLERSLQYFEAVSHDIVAPEEVSEILMYLALAYLEDGTNVVRPLDVLQEMIRRDPGRKLQRGYYPDFIIQYYENARDTLWQQLREQGPPREESERIAGLIDADYVFHAYAIPVSGEGVELVAYLYDRAEQELLPAERLTVQEVDEELIREGFGRLASRLSACLVEAPPGEIGDGGEVGGPSDFSVALAMTYGSFLQVPSPLEQPFGNYGVSVGAGWAVTGEFQLMASAQIANSIRDYAGVLSDEFTTIRAVVGGQLGTDFGPFHLGVGVGLELSRFGPVEVFTDKECIPDPDRLCPGESGRAIMDDHGLHWGVQLRPRVAWALSDTFQLSSVIAMGYYFSPLQGQLLNFPLTTEVGVEYRF